MSGQDKTIEHSVEEIDDVNVEIDRDAIVKEVQAYAKKKLKAVTDSLDRMAE